MGRQSSSDTVAPEPSRSRLETAETLGRVTFRVTDDQLAALESLVDDDVYHSRSEAIRAGIQRLLDHHDRDDTDRGSR